MATFFSSAAMLGVPGNTYKEGVVFTLFALNVPLAGARSVRSRIPHRSHWSGERPPHARGHDLGLLQQPGRAAPVGGSNRVLYAVPYVVLQIRAGGFLAQQMFSGQWSFEIGASALALIAMVYIMFGGMRSVAWTDVIQGLLLIGGMLLGGDRGGCRLWWFGRVL